MLIKEKCQIEQGDIVIVMIGENYPRKLAMIKGIGPTESIRTLSNRRYGIMNQGGE